MGISQSTLAMESGPERDERMEEVPAPEAERNTEEPPTGLVPSAGTLELQPEGETEAPTSKRHTEILELPKVDRRAPATPTVRPGGESATPATGKSRAERKQEKKTARKEEKTARKEEKRNRRAKQAEQAEEQEEKPEGTPSKTPVRRKLDAAMESAGEEERIKLMELRREEAEEAEAAQRVAEEVDEGSASRKRKLEELEEKKRALEEENDRKRKELEEESRRLKAVEEAERRAREQRSRNPRVQVPVASEKEKQETWFERKATELVENYIQAYGPQQKKSKEAAETYSTACEDSKQAHEDFISALQKTQEKAETLQKCLGRALEAAVAFGREEERAQQCAQAKDKCTRPEVPRVKARPQIPAGLQERIRKEKAQQEGSSTPGKKEESEVPTSTKPGPSLGVRARKQPVEEEPGKEWREKISSDVWKVGRQLKEGERYLECKYPPFTKEWQDGLREELLSLANRGFAKKEDGELYPTKRFGWQLCSIREFESINRSASVAGSGLHPDASVVPGAAEPTLAAPLVGNAPAAVVACKLEVGSPTDSPLEEETSESEGSFQESLGPSEEVSFLCAETSEVLHASLRGKPACNCRGTFRAVTHPSNKARLCRARACAALFAALE